MLSEGRGTTRPFELIGVPWADGELFAGRMNRVGLPGVHFRGVHFEPTFQKHAKTTCGGCQIHVLDRHAFKPVTAGVSLIRECLRHGAGPLPVARAALRIRARQDADRHPGRLPDAQAADREPSAACKISSRAGAPASPSSRRSGGTTCCIRRELGPRAGSRSADRIANSGIGTGASRRKERNRDAVGRICAPCGSAVSSPPRRGPRSWRPDARKTRQRRRRVEGDQRQAPLNSSAGAWWRAWRSSFLGSKRHAAWAQLMTAQF